MPTRRFRPTLDTLPRRIAPSDLAPIPAMATTPPTPPPTASPLAMPGSTGPIDPGLWTQPVDGLNVTMDPNEWIAAKML